jgi:hypothetical protein
MSVSYLIACCFVADFVVQCPCYDFLHPLRLRLQCLEVLVPAGFASLVPAGFAALVPAHHPVVMLMVVMFMASETQYAAYLQIMIIHLAK